LSGPEATASAKCAVIVADDAGFAAADPVVFSEPWQAQAFAIVVELNQRGVITWAEWAEALATEVGRPEAVADGSDYYTRWLAALESLLNRKGVAAQQDVDATAAAWQRAAHATPHGQPIALENDPASPHTHGRSAKAL